jgi:hypothetical protein
MRIVPPFMLIVATCLNLPVCGADAFGVWRANPSRSRNTYNHVVVVRFEPHPKGEVFTWDQIDPNGRSTTASTILYLDGKAHEFEGFGCSGTQLSRRLDAQTVEIQRTCGSGELTTLVRRSAADPKELVLEITERQTNGRRLERRLVMEKR